MNYGDADMINFRDEEGRLMLPSRVLERPPLYEDIQRETGMFGATGFIPFSSLHRYQRRDSVWAQQHVASTEQYAEPDDRPTRAGDAYVFPAFIRYCCETDTFSEICPPVAENVVYEPADFGDNWTDELEKEDTRIAAGYFQAIEKLRDAYDFVNLRVGGRDNVIDLNRGGKVGLTFEAPRHSLMTAIRACVFDDLLIGNYMRTTLHGSQPELLPLDFARYVAKWGDNGGARTKRELRAYMAEYARRAPLDFLLAQFAERCKNLLRPGLGRASPRQDWLPALRGKSRWVVPGSTRPPPSAVRLPKHLQRYNASVAHCHPIGVYCAAHHGDNARMTRPTATRSRAARALAAVAAAATLCAVFAAGALAVANANDADAEAEPDIQSVIDAARAGAGGPAEVVGADYHPLEPLPRHSDTSVAVVDRVGNYHIQPQPLDDEASQRVFERYLRHLDYRRMHLLAADVAALGKYRERLDDALQEGDLAPAFAIYNTYRRRALERVEYETALLAGGVEAFDFDLDEAVQTNRADEAPWPATREELENLWRLALKSRVLSGKLAGESLPTIAKILAKRVKNRLRRVRQTRSEDVFRTFINAFASTYDRHTRYFSPRESEDFNISMSLSLEGIGAELGIEGDYTVVERLVPGGPADRGGELRPSDRIVAVSQSAKEPFVDFVGWRTDDVVQLIRGPKDSPVLLKVLPAGAETSATEVVTIVRNVVKLEDQAVSKHILDVPRGEREYRIGVIDVPIFYLDFEALEAGEADPRSTTRDVARLIDELKAEGGVDALVVDVRGNGGGSLQEAVALTGLFMESGPVVQVSNLRRAPSKHHDTDGAVAWDGPLAVMVNQHSASASEIFAGAIQESRHWHRGGIADVRQGHGANAPRHAPRQAQVDAAEVLSRVRPKHRPKRRGAGHRLPAAVVSEPERGRRRRGDRVGRRARGGGGVPIRRHGAAVLGHAAGAPRGTGARRSRIRLSARLEGTRRAAAGAQHPVAERSHAGGGKRGGGRQGAGLGEHPLDGQGRGTGGVFAGTKRAPSARAHPRRAARRPAGARDRQHPHRLHPPRAAGNRPRAAANRSARAGPLSRRKKHRTVVPPKPPRCSREHAVAGAGHRRLRRPRRCRAPRQKGVHAPLLRLPPKRRGRRAEAGRQSRVGAAPRQGPRNPHRQREKGHDPRHAPARRLRLLHGRRAGAGCRLHGGGNAMSEQPRRATRRIMLWRSWQTGA